MRMTFGFFSNMTGATIMGAWISGPGAFFPGASMAFTARARSFFGVGWTR